MRGQKESYYIKGTINLTLAKFTLYFHTVVISDLFLSLALALRTVDNSSIKNVQHSDKTLKVYVKGLVIKDHLNKIKNKKRDSFLPPTLWSINELVRVNATRTNATLIKRNL